MEESLHVSSRQNPAVVSKAGFTRITWLDLRCHPYRRHVWYNLLEVD